MVRCEARRSNGRRASHNSYRGGHCDRPIENACHWCLDVTFEEDQSRVRQRQLRDNFAWLNRLALSLLKQHPGPQSVAMKRRSCGWSDEFLMDAITASIC